MGQHVWKEKERERDKEEGKGGREKREERDCDMLRNFLTLYFVINFGHF